jgi:hypothetical protein
MSGGMDMSRMVRKQIYIESCQHSILKQQARNLGVTEAEIIRRAIDHQMAFVRLDIRDLKAWEQEKAFISKRMAKGPAQGGRRWNREDAYEERLIRYGR